MSELEVLVQQLDEVFGEPIVDLEDALEAAEVAGLAARAGAPEQALADAVAWRDGVGQELLVEVFDSLEDIVADYLEALDGVLEGDADPEAVEDAVSDVDDLLAAAIWAGRRAAVRDLARRAAKTVRDVPEPFAALAPLARDMARSPAVARDLDLYDIWLAIADAGQWTDAPST